MANINNPTPVQSPITPGTDDRNSWATHYAKYGAGGFLMVDTESDAQSISAERRVDKMIYVKDSQKFMHHNGTDWADTSVGNGSVPQSVLDEIAANKAELERIKTHTGGQPTDIFSYRGRTAPTLPAGKKGYYLSFYSLQDASQRVTLPDNAVEGVIVSIDNQDPDKAVQFVPSGSDTYDGNSVTYVNIPPQNISFLIKDDNNNWIKAFGGLIPVAIGNLMTAIKNNLTGSLHTIPEIQAALKDRLHTFTEIQNEFHAQLHSVEDLYRFGFENVSIYFGFVTSNSPLPTEADGWVTGRMNTNRDATIEFPGGGNKYMGLVIPTTIAPLVSDIKINDAVVAFTQSDYTQFGLNYKLFLSDVTLDLSSAIHVEFDLSQKAPINGKDESFKYFSGSDAITIPTTYDNVVMDLTINTEITQPIPSVFNFESGARIFLRNMNDYHNIILQAPTHQSIEGLSTHVVEPRQNVELIIDKPGRRIRVNNISNDPARIDSLHWIYYGWTTDVNQPADHDEDWLEGIFPATKEGSIRKTELGDVYVWLVVPAQLGGMVQRVMIDGSGKEVIKSNYIFRGHKYKIIRVSETVSMDTAHTMSILWGVEQPPISVGAGIQIDDGSTDVTEIGKINVKGMSIAQIPGQGGMGDHEIELVAGPNIHMMAPDQQSGLGIVNEISIEPPLNVFDDPDSANQYALRMGIQHGYYELAKPPNYLAYMTEEEEVTGRLKPGATGVRYSTIWFDDIIVPGNMFLPTNKADKSFTLQDYMPDDDPNVSGGKPFLIIARLQLKGKAPSDGFVELMLRSIDKGTADQDGNVLLDINGNPIGFNKHYSDGEEFGFLEVASIYMAKGAVETQIMLEHSFTSDNIIITDRTEGISGIMIQALRDDYKTGDALQQFENDTLQNIEFSSHYNGEDIFNINYFLFNDVAAASINPGDGETNADGFHFYNTTKCNTSIQNKTFFIADDGTDDCYFNMGKIFNSEKTSMLRGKELDITVGLENKANAYDIYMAKWVGVPDKYSKQIITDKVATNPTMEPHWSLDPFHLEINADPVSGEHSVTGKLTVPSDAVNFAIIIAPKTKERPLSLQIKKFQVDVSEPFTGYIIHAPELIGERHLVSSEKHAKFVTNIPDNYVDGRYTINHIETKLPAGAKMSGKADIELDPTWTTGSSVGQFINEGDLKFNKEGTATLSTSARVHVGESVPAHGDQKLTLWWAKKLSDGGFDEIIGSEFEITLNKDNQKYIMVNMPKFRITVEPGDTYRLFGQTEIDDGAYIQSNSHNVPLITTIIDFDEFTAEAQMAEDIHALSELTFVDYKYVVPSGITISLMQDPLDLPLGVKVIGNSDIDLLTSVNSVLKLHVDCSINASFVVVVEKALHAQDDTVFVEFAKKDGDTYTPLKTFDLSISGSADYHHIIGSFSGVTLNKDDEVVLRAYTQNGEVYNLRNGDSNHPYGVSLKMLVNEINLSEKEAIDKILLIDQELVITDRAIQHGWYMQLDYDPDTGTPSLGPKQRTINP